MSIVGNEFFQRRNFRSRFRARIFIIHPSSFTISIALMVMSLSLSITTPVSAEDKAPPTANARAAAELIAEGNKHLTEKKYQEALDAYEKAQKELPRSAEIAYNRGIALYRLGKFAEAESAFQDALSTSDINLEASTKFNLGRAAHEQALTRGQDLKNAVNDLTRAAGFYKDALQIRPEDAPTRHNLELAEKLQGYFEKLIALQKEQQQQQQKGPSSQPSDGEKNPESQPSDEQQQGENQQTDQQDGEQKQQASQNGQQQKSKDQQAQQKENEQQQNEGENAEQQEPTTQPEDKKDKEKKQEKPATTQPAEKKDATTQPAQQAESQPATSQPEGDDGAGEDEMDPKDLSQEQAMQMLQEARDAERQRREMQRRIKLRQQGQSPVDKDW